jgi:uncharacterized protein with PCYCGC motif
MDTSRRITAISAAIGVAAFGLMLIPRQAASGAQQGSEPTPAYHSQVPSGALPQTMDPTSFNNNAVKNAYAVAAKVRRVLYQQPCYCHCDRSIGHESLLDCYVGKHASVCDVCMREAFYAYEQTQKKKTPAEIRAGIERGEWQQVDMSKYETSPAK